MNALSIYQKQLSNEGLKSVLGGETGGIRCGCTCNLLILLRSGLFGAKILQESSDFIAGS
ncbi:MAG: hypothetical protein JXR48_08200 [Candidatus Delongbacteria bacterium]|nr:hypothetical protein [Candidatus Delongbacteria bacterium]